MLLTQSSMLAVSRPFTSVFLTRFHMSAFAAAISKEKAIASFIELEL